MVNPSQWPCTIIMSKKDHWEMFQWCEQQFGRRWSVIDNRQGIWACFWAGKGIPGHYRWEFKNVQDAALFALRWS